MLISLLGTIVGIALIFKYLPRTQLGRGVVLATVGPAGPATAGAPEDRIGVGDVGKAVTDLKPFGKARLGDERIEVVAEGGYVTKGSRVRVIRIAGTRIEVRGVDTDTSGG